MHPAHTGQDVCETSQGETGSPSFWIHRRQSGWSWWLRDSLSAELLQLLGASDWTTGLESGAIERIKQGRQRQVYRLTYPGGSAVYCKEFSTHSIADRCRTLFRGSPAHWEAERVRLAEERGLPTAALMGFGVSTNLWGPIRSRLLTASIEPSEMLANWRPPFEIPAAQPLRSRAQISATVASTAELLARLHGRGMWHQDLHAGNVLLQEQKSGRWRSWLIDLAGLRGGLRTPLDQIDENLARFWLSLDRLWTAADRDAFAHQYWQALRLQDPLLANQLGTTAERAANRLQDAAQHRLDTLHQRADADWQRGTRKVLVQRAGRSLARLGADWLQEFATKLPEWWGQGTPQPSSTLQTESRWVTVASPWGPQRLRLVRFHDLTVRRGWTPVRTAWETGHALARRGLSVGIPWGYLEQPQGHYLAICEPHDGQSLIELLASGRFSTAQVASQIQNLLSALSSYGFEPDADAWMGVRVNANGTWWGWCAPEALVERPSHPERATQLLHEWLRQVPRSHAPEPPSHNQSRPHAA